MTADDILARHRYNTIRHSIPDRLDRVADQLEDCLVLVARYGLAEALQPGASQHQHVSVEVLRDAATRIRTAARHIPWTGTAARPGTTSCGPGGDPVHGTAAES